MGQCPGHHGMAGSDLDGEVVGPSTGQRREDQPETAKRLIHHRRMRLGNFGHESRHRQINSEEQCGPPVQERDFRC